MPDEQPKKPFVPPSDKLGDVNFADTSEAQASATEKTREEVKQRLETLFKSILEDIVNNLPQQESISLDEFDQIIVDALTKYFDQKEFFKTGDEQIPQYSEKTLLKNKERVVVFAGEFVSFLESKKLIENPDIKTNVLQTIDDLYMQRVGLKKEEPQAEAEGIPDPSLDFILGKTQQSESETPKKLDQFPTLAKEKAKHTLTRLSEVYSDLVDQPDNIRRLDTIAKVAEDILTRAPDLKIYFMQHFGPVQVEKTRSGAENSDAAVESAEGPYDEPRKLVLLLVAMIGVLSSTNQGTRNYFFSQTETLKMRRDVGFVQAVSKLNQLANGSENNKPRFEEFSESNFLTPKQDWEEKLKQQIFEKKPFTQSARTA